MQTNFMSFTCTWHHLRGQFQSLPNTFSIALCCWIIVYHGHIGQTLFIFMIATFHNCLAIMESWRISFLNLAIWLAAFNCFVRGMLFFSIPAYFQFPLSGSMKYFSNICKESLGEWRDQSNGNNRLKEKKWPCDFNMQSLSNK